MKALSPLQSYFEQPQAWAVEYLVGLAMSGERVDLCHIKKVNGSEYGQVIYREEEAANPRSRNRTVLSSADQHTPRESSCEC